MTAPRIGMIAAALLGYAIASHLLMSEAPASPWTATVVLGPMLLAGLVLALRSALGRALLVLALLVLALGWAQGVLESWWRPQALYLAQHVGMQGMLGLAFGSTLRPGHVPLVSQLAARVHGELSPTMQAYTRSLTLAWTLEFALVVGVSVLLYVWAPLAWWSLWANVATPVLALVMFLVEYLLRYRLHPEFERVSLIEAVRAWRAQAS